MHLQVMSVCVLKRGCKLFESLLTTAVSRVPQLLDSGQWSVVGNHTFNSVGHLQVNYPGQENRRSEATW